MKKFEKFKNLSKGNRVLRIINLTIGVAMLATCIVALILNLKPDRHREIPTIGLIIATIAPYLLELILRRRLSNTLLFAYQIYMIVAGIVGAVFDLYYEVFWYDLFVHTIMGYIAAMLGIFVISKCTTYKKLNVLSVILFCFTFSLAVELVWELLEWFSDIFLGQTAQGGAYPGDIPLVTDTMQDILCNFSGTILFITHFVIGKFAKVSLGIKSIENQLAGGDCLKTFAKKQLPQIDQNSHLQTEIIEDGKNEKQKEGEIEITLADQKSETINLKKTDQKSGIETIDFKNSDKNADKKSNKKSDTKDKKRPDKKEVN